MRWLLLTTLLLAALAARADGFSYGKGFHMLHETDQLAVIDLDEEQADVSMYIAIDGIPAGETITYVLPFWYRPDGFSMEEMAPADYREKYVEPAHEKVVRMNRIADDRASTGVLTSAATCGLGFVGPFLTSTLGSSRSKGSAGAILNPYAVQQTAHARAELYKVQAKDLQQLVAQAGLPAEYVKPLKKYTTSFFAVMRLTGPGPKDRLPGSTAVIRPEGVCYRFRHAIPPEKRGVYVYPLGTGAAWTQPILLTEVYVTCPDRFSLQVSAPESGERKKSWAFHRKIQTIYRYQQLKPAQRENYFGGTTEEDLMASMMTHLLSEEASASSAWHVAYFNSNPSEDIHVRLTPRKSPWRLAVADAIFALTPYSSLTFAILGWLIAGIVVIRPRWQRAGKPGSLLIHTVAAMLVANLWVSIGLVVLGFMLAGVFALNPSGSNPIMSVILIAPAGLVLLWAGITLSRRSMKDKTEEWRYNLAMYSWLIATAVFLALNGGLYYFVRWCEAAV